MSHRDIEKLREREFGDRLNIVANVLFGATDNLLDALAILSILQHTLLHMLWTNEDFETTIKNMREKIGLEKHE